MARSRPHTGPDGLVVVDKPAGWTSHDVVAKSRGLLGTRKVGHAGTLAHICLTEWRQEPEQLGGLADTE